VILNPLRVAARLFGSRSSAVRPTPCPRRRSRLGVEELEDRANPTVTGSISGVLLNGGTYSAQGSASAPGYSSVTVEVFVNDSYQNGQGYFYYAATGQTDGSGNFSVAIPNSSMINTSSPTHGAVQVEVWAVDPSNNQGVQLQTSQSAQGLGQNPYYWTLYYGDATITNSDNTFAVQTDGQLGGVVFTITNKSDGFQYLDNRDDGRDDQTAIWGIPQSESPRQDLLRFNPTEGGSEADDTPQPYTHSYLQDISLLSSNELTTTTQMALWNANGTPTDGGLTAYNPDLTQGTNTLSDIYMSKDVTVGFAGLDNVIHQPVRVDVPAADQLQQDAAQDVVFQVQQIVFTNGTLHQEEYYNFANQQIQSTPSGANPVIETDGIHYIAIASRQLSGANTMPVQYLMGNGGNVGGQNYIQALWKGKLGTYEGTYSFDNYIVVGNYNQVLSALQTLQADGYIGTTNGWNQVNTGSFSQIVADANGDVFANSTSGVYEIPAGASFNQATKLNSGSYALMATDAIGNVFVGNSTGIFEIPAGSGYGTSYQLSSVAYTQMVADASGDLFVENGSGVYEIPAGVPNGTRYLLNGGSFSQMVVDASGDLFLGNGSGVYEIPAGSSVNSMVTLNGGAFSQMAVDASGDLFLESISTSGVWEIPAGSAYNYTVTLNPGYFPEMAVDASGDVFLGSSAGVFEIPVGATSSTAPVALAPPTSLGTPSLFAVSPNGDLVVGFPNYGLWQPPQDSKPYQILADSQGNLYEVIHSADPALAGVWKRSASTGLYQRIVSDQEPYQIAVDGNGDLFVAVLSTTQAQAGVWKLNASTGQYQQIISNWEPYQIAVDNAGDLFMAVHLANQAQSGVWKLSASTGQFQEIISNWEPYQIAVDNAGDLFMAVHSPTLAQGGVWRMTASTGQFQQVVSNQEPYQIAVDNGGDLFVAVHLPSQAQAGVWKLSASTGQYQQIISNWEPYQIAVDNAGDLFMVVHLTNQAQSGVWRLSASTGQFQEIISNWEPYQIAVDNAGDLFMSVEDSSGNQYQWLLNASTGQFQQEPF